MTCKVGLHILVEQNNNWEIENNYQNTLTITFLGFPFPSTFDHENLVCSFHANKYHIFFPNKLFIFFSKGCVQAIHKATQP